MTKTRYLLISSVPSSERIYSAHTHTHQRVSRCSITKRRDGLGQYSVESRLGERELFVVVVCHWRSFVDCHFDFRPLLVSLCLSTISRRPLGRWQIDFLQSVGSFSTHLYERLSSFLRSYRSLSPSYPPISRTPSVLPISSSVFLNNKQRNSENQDRNELTFLLTLDESLRLFVFLFLLL